MQKPLSESLRFVAVLWGEPSQKDKENLACSVLSYGEVIEKGKQNLTGFEANPVKISGSDLATLVYTSGTTGNPKVCGPYHQSHHCCTVPAQENSTSCRVAVANRFYFLKVQRWELTPSSNAD